jgi:hypothetical protein
MRTISWLCLLSLLTPLGAQTTEDRSAARLSELILARLARVAWDTPYPESHAAPGETCQLVPPHTTLRRGLYDYAYHCLSAADGVIAESFYYPTDDESPRVVLRRADFRLADNSPELSAQVEQRLQARFAVEYGPGAEPGHLFEIGAYLPHPGLSWLTGGLTLFLHHNRLAVTPSGIRTGVQLIAVRREVLDLRARQATADQAMQTDSSLSRPAVARDLARELGSLYTPPGVDLPATETGRAAAEAAARAALLKLLDAAGMANGDRRAAALVAADQWALRLGALLVCHERRPGSEVLSEAPDADSVRQQLEPYGIRYGAIGHNSGVLEYNRGLLSRAWKELPETPWGQRAFLMMQPLACAVALPEPCPGPACFRMVIREGEQFLRADPQSQFRREQLYQLALAYETWWSLSQAAPSDPTAEGAQVDPSGGDQARRMALSLYMEVIRLAPHSPEAMSARLRLPRLKLSLDTGERAFFCFTC